MLPGRGFHQQGAHHALQSALAGQVRHHPPLGVPVGLQFEQVVGAIAPVGRAAAMQHQPLAAGGHHLVQPGHQLRPGRHPLLGHRFQVRRRMGLQKGTQFAQPAVEGALGAGQVEHHVIDVLPLLRLWLGAAQRAHQAGEGAAPAPQFTVQGLVREPLGEAGRGADHVAVAADQPLTVPVGAHAVELFADPVIGEVHVVLVDIGQHQRRGGLAVAHGGRHGEKHHDHGDHEIHYRSGHASCLPVRVQILNRQSRPPAADRLSAGR
ncbi:hypothetical protein ASALC70_00457 [Alcanivorax sp. ALC70]|nr:hypothetical protein ASALC70_00457 [Alcanivorax sp. ALC70]